MAKEPNPELEAEELVDETPRQPRSYRIHLLVGLILLVMVQTTIMYRMLPDPKATQQQLAANDDPDLDGTRINVIPPDGAEKIEMVERSLGERFNIEQSNPEVPGGQLLFSALISVEIAKKDEKAFDKIYPTRENRIRQEVDIILRNSSLTDRREATLGTIRRRIRDKVNEVLDENKNYVRDVLCTDAKEGER